MIRDTDGAGELGLVLLNRCMNEHAHLYDDDGALMMGSKLWFLDVVDGRIALLPEQIDDFLFLLGERGHGRFYGSATEAYILDFQRVQGRFASMLAEVGDD